MGLTDGEIDRMRSVAEDYLPGTAVIQSGTLVSDGGGGGTQTWTAAGTVACRVAPITGTEGQVGGRIAEDSDWLITLPAETTVDTDDQIVVGSQTFNVVAVRERSWELTRGVECREVV